MSRIWTVADDINYHLNLDYLRHSSVEEVEGKCSPNETPDFGNERLEGGGGYQAGAGTSSASSTAAAAAAGSSRGAEPGSSKGQPDYRRASSSSHQSQQSDGQSDRQHSDSTSISKTQATSSGSPNESPGRLSEFSRSRSKSVGEQQWTNLRAVLAWYARLRRIKRSKSNQRWMKLRTTVQLTGAIQTIQKKAPLKREDSFLKRFSTRQIPEAQDTFEVADDDGTGGAGGERTKITRKKKRSLPRTVVNPDGNFYFYWLMILTFCVLYNLWTLIVRQSFPELQSEARVFWILADSFSDLVFLLDIAVQFRTGYLEQGLMVYKTKKLANHYIGSKPFYFDLCSLLPTDLFQLYFGTNPMFRFPRFLKIYRTYNYYYMVESRTVYPNVWRVVNLIHILLLLAHWFGCFYFLLSEAEHFKGPWVYPDPTNPNNTDFQSLTRKYLGSLYWSTLTLTTIGDLPTPHSNWQYLFTIVSYLIGVFIFATIVGQVGNVITNRNANRLEFERLLDGAKMYMRHHKVPRDMQRRVLRWYDYSWSRGRIQGGGDINTALGLLPDKLKTELALHVNLSVLKKVTIFQECQPEFLHDLVLKMKAYIFTPGDLICRKGEVAREMFIIADGILEVISEQGKVLTTMQAGDFFGEIGILNLDGLNKRTADVRSVGYSELFSLSREDVLAAMKDYPEAQEILQTLGRKRLMEARKASGSANPKKPSSDGKKALAGSSKETPESSGQGTDNTTGKRIVEKLQSDFKGLKDVIRRSRKSNSSRDDSSEPDLDGDGISRDAKSFPPPRGVLKRMHNVLSDEKEKEPSTSTSTSTSSPSVLSKRGVGGKRVQLPLLLKAAAAASSSPQAQVQSPEKEPEVIGEGLPLMQRLRLLKQKEERERKQQEEREAMMKSLVPTQKKPQSPPSNIPCDGDGVAGPSQSGIVRTKASVEPIPSGGSSVEAKDSPVNVAGGKDGEKRDSISSIESGSFSSPASSSLALAHRTLSPPIKPVSLLIGEAAAIAASRATTEPISISVPPMPPKLTSQIASSPPVLYGSMSPPVQESSVGRDRSASASSAPTCSTSREPVTILRPAALHFRQKTYGSVDDLSPEFSRLPFVKKLKILNERQKIAALLMSKTSSNILTRSTSEGSNDQTTVTGSLPSSEGIEDTAQMHSLLMGRRTQSNQEQLQGSSESGLEELTPTTTSSITIQLVQAALGKYDQSPPEREVKNKGVVISGTNEGGGGCTGLSSVQQHRQHQHEVAKILDDSNATNCLTKLEGQGDADGDGGDGSTLDRNSCKITPSRLSPSPTSGPVSSAKKRKKKKLHTSPTKEKGEEEATSSSSSSSTTTSPPEMDSSETPERRNLKSILKRLAKSEEAAETEAKKAGVVPATVNKKIEERKLLKAPTIEGYAARHRKFAKNVTFHRQAVTVVSPEDLAKAEKSTLHIAEACQDIPYEPISDFRLSSQADMIPVSDDPFSEENLKSFKNMMLVKGEDLPFHPSALQIGLNIAQEECIGSVFIGIKAIIQSKVDEIHARFQDNFNTLEHEVRKRDEIIFRLQRRIHELEKFSDRKRSRNGNGMREEYDPMDYGGHDGDNEMDDLDVDNEDEELLLDPDSSSSEARRYPLEFQTSYLFSRGDSIDTVISAQDYEDEVFERAEALSQAVDQPASFSSEEQGQQQHHQHRRSRDMGNGEWEQKHSSASWAHVAGEERIEMREFGTAPWQVEFHRDRDSLPPPNERTLGTRNIDKDSVAVDIGNSSTDYEGSSSGSEETNNKGEPRHRHHHQQQQPQQPISQKPQQRTKSGVQEVLHRRLKEEPVALDDDEEGDQTDVASDDDDEDDSDDSSGDEPQLTNKNWEVQLLAKEMDKIETRSRPENLEMLGEAKYLQNEIQQMHDAVSSGELSTSELDMLESMLESKSRQVKALVKALSVETQAPPSGGESKPGSSKQIVAKPKTIARSVDDLHGASSSAGSSSSLSRPLATMERLQLAPSQLAPTTSTHFQPRRSLGILPSVPSSLAKPSTSASFRERVSPGERSELHKLFLSRKRSTTVRRQTSLCETSLTHSTTLSETKSERRRESFPVSVPSQEASSSSSAKSFFSKFSLVRQITQRGSSKRSSCIEMEPRSSTATPAVVAMELANETQTQSVHTCSGNTMATITAAAAITTTTSSSASTQDTSSEMVQEQMSSVVNILPGNSGSGPVQAAATATIVTRTSESVVVSIPDVTSSVQPCSSRSLTTSTTSKPGGENQPLLKK